ncbi:MAG: nucleotidyl transferase AbiEii/AbiGii toxin family protein [Candidatus Hydrothermarchaeales archaeon]
MREFIQKYGEELCGKLEFFLEETLRGHVEKKRASNLTNLLKAVHVLEYLGQLRREGLDPLFKGGSAVQLLLPNGWQRLSIDLDLAMEVSRDEVEEALRGIHERFGSEYYSYEPREGKLESGVPFYNYRITVPTFGGEAIILLDIMLVDLGYERQRKALRSFFYESEVEVETPTMDAILGDKLSTLGPDTIGRYLRDSRNGLEYVKHLYDIKQLLPHVKDLNKTFAAYRESYELQLRIRNIKLDLDASLKDLIHVCKFLTLTKDTAVEQTSLLGGEGAKTLEYFRICNRGLARFQPFLTLDNVFTWENVRETAAVIAFAAKLMEQGRMGKIGGEATDLLRSAMEGALRIAQDEAVVDKMIEEIASQPAEERWHINSNEIKESPLLTVFWYGYWSPERFAEYL